MNRYKISNFIIQMVRCCGMIALLGTLLPISVGYADGFGVNQAAGSANQGSAIDMTNAKIDSLIGSSQAGYITAPPANTSQNQQAATKNEPPTSENPYGNDPVGAQAFAGMARNLLPLTPEQIKTLHYLFSKTREAAAQYPGVPPKPTSTALNVNLSPGAVPPVIRLQKGFVSSLVFVDATGAPWPIQAYDLGDSQTFNVKWDKKGNTLMVQATAPFTSGNLAIMLRGLDTPVMITLMPGQHAVDYRADLRIPRMGPNANPALEGLPQTESPDLMNVLNGIPPEKAQALVVKGGDAQAWLVGDHLYLRTDMTLVSPAFTSTMSSPDGTHAYEVQATPVLLALSQGKTVTLTIEGL